MKTRAEALLYKLRGQLFFQNDKQNLVKDFESLAPLKKLKYLLRKHLNTTFLSLAKTEIKKYNPLTTDFSFILEMGYYSEKMHFPLKEYLEKDEALREKILNSPEFLAEEFEKRAKKMIRWQKRFLSRNILPNIEEIGSIYFGTIFIATNKQTNSTTAIRFSTKITGTSAF